MLFSQTLDKIDSEIAELLAQVEAAKQRQTQLMELDALTDSTLGQLGDVVGKIGQVAPDAIASLKSAVLTLFDNGNDGGNQPTDPTPGPDDDEPELLCLNGLTGECLTTADLDDEELPIDDPIGNEWILASDTPLTGQTCAIDPEQYLEVTPPDGSSWQLASSLACGVWEDAPLMGQHCTITPNTSEDNENKGTTGEGENMPYIELVIHSDNKALAYQRKHDGEIICTYIGFPTKAKAQSWLKFVEALAHTTQLRQAKRLEGFKWEIKAKGLSVKQIDRLAGEALDKTYRSEIGSAKPPSYKEEAPRLPVNPDEVEPGDIVTPLLTPGDSYEVIQVMPNGILDCKSLRTGVQMGMRSTAVTLVQKAPKVEVEPPETLHCNLLSDPSPQLQVKILLPLSECKWHGQVLPVVATSRGGTGYSVETPEGVTWFRSDVVQVIDAEIEALADPTEPITLDQRNGTISQTEWKELQSLAKSGGLTQEELGEIALIPHGYTRGGEIRNSQLAEITAAVNQAQEVKKKALAADKGYITTTGNYTGLTRQALQRWEKAGIDPQELIASMRSKRPPEPEWNADKYNPVLIAMGDDASDF